jgi:hypothetical protein
MTVRLEKLSRIDNQESKVNQFSFEFKRGEKITLIKVARENTYFKAFTSKSVNDIFIKENDKHLKSDCLLSTAQIIADESIKLDLIEKSDTIIRIN